MTDRKKPGVVFWATVVLVVVVLYFASFGPACWITSHTNVGARAVPSIYRPLTRTFSMRPEGSRVGNALLWYARFAAKKGWMWFPDFDLDDEVDEDFDSKVRWTWQYMPPMTV
jgi:hypothetical protein